MARKSVLGLTSLVVALTGLLVPAQGSAVPSAAHVGSARSYVVVLKPGATASAVAADAARRYGLKVSAVYSHALQGYTATVPADQLAALRADPAVAYVEPNQTVQQPRDASATLSGALTATPEGGDTPQSCQRAQVNNPNPVRLQLCLRGLSMLSITGVQPGLRPAAASSMPSRPTEPQQLPGCTTAPGDDRCEAWVGRFNHADQHNTGGNNVFEFPLGMAVSPTGDQTFVAGVSWDLQRGEQTMVILAYDARTGRRNWAALPFSGAGGGCGGCAVTGIAVSPDGTQVYVNGYTQNSGTYADIRTMALDARTGAVLWDRRYNRPASYISVDLGLGIAVSPDGSRVYGLGYTFDPFNYGSTKKDVLIGYDARTGNREWKTFSALNSSAFQIRAAGDRIYTVGNGLNADGSHLGISTKAYDGRTGAQLWRTDYDGPAGASDMDYGFDLAVSPTGNRVYITGAITIGPNFDLAWLTAAYNADSGRELWTQRYADQSGQQAAHAIAASPTGDRVYAVGYSLGKDGYFKPTTVAYDAATGAQAWTETYALQRFSGGRWNGVTVSPDGSRLYVAGYYSNAAAGFDYVTLGLDASNGGDHWVAHYNSSYRSTACLSYDGGLYTGLSPDGRRVYVTGFFSAYYSDNAYDIGTLAYDTAGGVENPPAGPVPPPPASECPQLLPTGVDRIDADVSSTQAGNGSGSVTGVNAYVIANGIDPANAELNVVNQVNFTVGQNYDCNGYGTALAGVIGARDNAVGVVGVAPGVALTSVKVVDCSRVGTLGQVLSGIDWVTAHAAKPAVADMSLQFAPSRALDRAVTASADSGVFYAVMAGNNATDCSEGSPAGIGGHRGVMAVAATDKTGAEAGYSDFGSCVSIWAPGDWVLTTALHGGDVFGGGTEFAAPHVAGTAALYLSQHPRTSPAALKRILQRDGTLTGFTSKDGTTPVLQVYAGKY